MNDNVFALANKMGDFYRPRTNAVIVTLHEHQGEDGSIERRLTYSIEVKDQHLERDLRRLASELMNLRGLDP